MENKGDPVRACEKVPHEQRGGYLHAEDDDTPYYVDGLRYCGRCHHFLDEGESHRAAPAPVATPTPDIDPEELRHRVACELSTPEMEALLAAAERALVLEDVLVVAKEFADAIAVHPLCDCAVCDLRAAIDRAEGKP